MKKKLGILQRRIIMEKVIDYVIALSLFSVLGVIALASLIVLAPIKSAAVILAEVSFILWCFRKAAK